MGGYSTKFGTDLLQRLGVPVSEANMQYLAAWAQAEGGNASYNPFNTTEPYSGAGNYNSVGVKNYPSYQAGLDATAKTLQNGDYQAILSALAAGTSAMADAQAEASTPWGTGTLIEKVLGGTVNTPPSTTPNAGNTPVEQGSDPTNSMAFDSVFTQGESTAVDASKHGGILGALTGGLADKIPGVGEFDGAVSGLVTGGAKAVGKATAEAFAIAFAPFLQPVDDVFKALEEILSTFLWFIHPTNDLRILIFAVGIFLMAKGFLSVLRS